MRRPANAGFVAFVVLSTVFAALLALLAWRTPSAGPNAAPGMIDWQLPAILIAWFLVLFVCARLLFHRSEAPTLRAMVIGILLSAFPLLFFAPLSSTDVYAYGYHGRLVSVHHINPYGISDQAELHDPYFTLTRARAPYQTTYGPLWTTLSAAITALTGDRISLTVFFFRLLNLGALLGIVLILFSHLKKKTNALWALAFASINPLVLFEGIQNAHNDLFMTFFLVAALDAALRRKSLSLFPLLTVSILIKLLPLALLPVAAAYVWKNTSTRRDRVGAFALGGTVSTLLVLAAFAPYWIGFATFHVLFELGRFWAAPFFHPLAMVAAVFQRTGATVGAAREAARTAGQALFLLVVLFSTGLTALKRWPISHAFIVLLVGFFAFGVTYIQPWYFLWFLPFLPLLSGRVREYAIYTATLLPIASYPLFMLP